MSAPINIDDEDLLCAAMLVDLLGISEAFFKSVIDGLTISDAIKNQLLESLWPKKLKCEKDGQETKV